MLLKNKLAVSGFVIFLLGLFTIDSLRAQIFVADYYGRAVGEYDPNTGAAINSSLISFSDLRFPTSIAISGSNLYLATNSAQAGGSTVGEYTMSGGVVNASLVSGFQGTFGIAVLGSHLLVGNYNSGTISEYDASTGALINASFITGLHAPVDMVISGNDLFVTNQTSGTIGEYNALTGATLNASLVQGLNDPSCITISGNDLFVTGGGFVGEFTTSGATLNRSLITGAGAQGIAAYANDLFIINGNKVGEYTTAGTLVNPSFISGLTGAFGITVEEVPEPSTWTLFFGGIGFLIFVRLRTRSLF